MYSAPPTHPGANPPQAYPPPHSGHSATPYGAPNSPPPHFGQPPMGIPKPCPTGMPTSIPTPMPTYPHGQQQPQYPTSPTGPMSPTYAPMVQPHFQHQAPNSILCGPLLRYQNLDIRQGLWIGSVLVVSRPEVYGHLPPVLEWSDGLSAPQVITAEAIDSYERSMFWRFELRIPQDMNATKRITYSLNTGPTKYSFFVAGRNESFRWMFYSCNGFSSSTDAGKCGVGGLARDGCSPSVLQECHLSCFALFLPALAHRLMRVHFLRHLCSPLHLLLHLEV